MSTVAAAIPGIKAIRADEWGGEEAYLWQETGNGALDRVCYTRRDWWIVTVSKDSHTRSMFTHSWCCCPDTTLYVCDSKPTRDALESALQSDLAARRARWAKAGAA